MNRDAARLLVELERYPVALAGGWERVRNLLGKHSDTAFGRAKGFCSIQTPEDFRQAIPPLDYEAFWPWIERAAAGEKRVLGCGEVIGFERTSGTSSRAKWIPLTEGLQEEFAIGLAAWFGGWRRRCPEVFEGRAYWAISPPGMEQEKTAGGLPVGMTGDAAYFPCGIGEILADWLVIPELSGRVEGVFEETAARLLGEADLSLVSVWSPTFLLGIDAALRRMRGDRTWRELWPRLALVSCWADASSAPWIPRLRERLGGVPIESKGLLATEGITSLPDFKKGEPRLASECHWHEFLDESGCFVETSKVRLGASYEVLLTTSGGLFRYRSGDRVRVIRSGVDGLPRLEFIGRGGCVSDLVGEKLHEEHVSMVLGGRGFLVADLEIPCYVRWLEDQSMAQEIEGGLRMNPYFDQALRLRQLAPLEVSVLPDDWCAKLTTALAASRGCRVGDVKLLTLLTREKPEEVASWMG